jgi:hypothetical protein
MRAATGRPTDSTPGSRRTCCRWSSASSSSARRRLVRTPAVSSSSGSSTMPSSLLRSATDRSTRDSPRCASWCGRACATSSRSPTPSTSIASNRLTARGSPLRSRRDAGGQRHGLAGGELTARGVDLGAAVLAHRGVPRATRAGRGTRARASGSTRGRIARRRVERDEVDVGPRTQPAAQRRELGGVAVTVVDPVDHRPLEADATVLRVEVLGAGVDEVVDRIATVDRHELVAELVVRGVERHGEVDRQRTSGERRMPGRMPTVLIVMCRADSPRSPWSRSTDSHTVASLASGSPMPM